MKKLNFLFWNIGGLSSYQNDIERVIRLYETFGNYFTID